MWKLYDETRATTWKLYAETRATARNAEMRATARKLYDETRATAHAAICVADCPWRNGTLFPDEVTA